MVKYTKEQLIELFKEMNFSVSKIKENLRMNDQNLRKLCQEAGLTVNDIQKQLRLIYPLTDTKVSGRLKFDQDCFICHRKFKSARSDCQFCSKSCRVLYSKLLSFINLLETFDILEFNKENIEKILLDFKSYRQAAKHFNMSHTSFINKMKLLNIDPSKVKTKT